MSPYRRVVFAPMYTVAHGERLKSPDARLLI
jgi:hypothetical protein